MAEEDQKANYEKYQALKKELESVNKEIEKVDEEIAEAKKEASDEDQTVIIKALHDYNEMRDFATTIIERLSDYTNVPCTELYIKYKIPTFQP